VLLEKIESIRKKPKEVRNRYAFWTAFLITFVIAAVWLASVPARLAGLTNTPLIEQEKVQGGFSRTFSNMKASLMEGFTPSENLQEKVPDVSTNIERKDTIDFDTFFTASSTPAVTEKVKLGKEVLIGTSSKIDLVSTED
jgi:hypothetical protein